MRCAAACAQAAGLMSMLLCSTPPNAAPAAATVATALGFSTPAPLPMGRRRSAPPRCCEEPAAPLKVNLDAALGGNDEMLFDDVLEALLADAEAADDELATGAAAGDSLAGAASPLPRRPRRFRRRRPRRRPTTSRRWCASLCLLCEL